MAEPDIGAEERDRRWRTAEGVNRADAGLRRFERYIGDAVMCFTCEGTGYVLRSSMHHEGAGSRPIVEPVKCSTCGGEGLDPHHPQGGGL